MDRGARRRGRVRGGAAAAASRHPAVPGNPAGALVDRGDPGAAARAGSHADAQLQRQPGRVAGGRADRAARPADGGHRGSAAPAAARVGHAGFGGISAATCGVVGWQRCFRVPDRPFSPEHGAELCRPRRSSSAPPTDSPSARWRVGEAFAGARASRFTAESRYTPVRGHCLLPARMRAILGPVQAIAASVCADTRTTTNLLLCSTRGLTVRHAAANPGDHRCSGQTLVSTRRPAIG